MRRSMQHSKTTHNAPLHGLPLLRQQPPHHYAGVGRSTVPGHSAQHERGVRTSACVQVSAWGGRAWIGLPNLGEVMTGCVAYAHTRTAPALFSAAAAEQSVLPVIRACDVCVCLRAHLRATVRAFVRAAGTNYTAAIDGVCLQRRSASIMMQVARCMQRAAQRLTRTREDLVVYEDAVGAGDRADELPAVAVRPLASAHTTAVGAVQRTARRP